MKPSEIISKARTLAYVDSTNYPDATAVIDLNNAYYDFTADVVSETNESWFWNEIKTDSVIGQREYVIEESGTDDKINEVDEVYVKYATGGEYKKARRIHPSELVKDREWYEDNQSKEDPVYFIQDQSVWIYPVATEAVTNGIKLHATLQPAPLSLYTDTEDSIKVPRRFHQVLVEGIVPYIYRMRGMLNEANVAQQLYDKKKNESLAQLKNRDQGIVQIGTPDLSHYE